MLQSSCVWQEKAVLSYHRNVTVKIVMPRQVFKAQYSKNVAPVVIKPFDKLERNGLVWLLILGVFC